MIIEVKVITRSSVDAIIGFEGDVLKIKCRAIAEKGKANEVVIDLLAKHYKVPKSHISILRGSSSARKLISIE